MFDRKEEKLTLMSHQNPSSGSQVRFTFAIGEGTFHDVCTAFLIYAENDHQFAMWQGAEEVILVAWLV